jgi:hypothetical protein
MLGSGLPVGRDIRICCSSVSGYQQVDIRISEYQDKEEVLVWCPDSLVPCTLIS